MDNTLLSYASLKCVLQHMEANLRFQVSNQIPSIRTAEKAVPLKISNLSLSKKNTQITVNDTTYTLEVSRKYHHGKGPKRPSNLPVDYDIDKYGFSDSSSDAVITPGDIAIFSESVPQRTAYGMENDAELIREIPRNLPFVLTISEKKLAKLLEQRNAMNQNNENNEEKRKDLNEAIERHEYQLDQLRDTALRYQCRADDVEPPYDCYLHLAIVSPLGSQVEVVMYKQKIYQGVKYLATKFFGGRKHKVQVQRLELRTSGIIRLPAGLKLMIRELQTIHSIERTYEALKPVVVESSYPLDVLDIVKCQRDFPDVDYPVLKSARYLVLTGLVGNWLLYLQNLRNPKVHKTHGIGSFDLTKEDYILLIRNWSETGRDIGTCFTFEIQDEKTVMDLLVLIKNQLNGKAFGERCVTLPMINAKELNVSYEMLQKERWLECIMKIEVVSSVATASTI